MNAVYILLCLPLLLNILSESCKDSAIQQLISGSRYRVQDQFFESNSVNRNIPPEQEGLEGIKWCSPNASTPNASTPSSKRPWLQVTFGVDVNISIIEIGKNFTHYVIKFEVHVGKVMEEILPSPGTQLMERVLSNVLNTTLSPPVTTQVLRIVPVEWAPMDGPACLTLEAFGCPVSPVCKTEGLLTNDVEFFDSITGNSSIPSDNSVNYTVNDRVSTSNASWCIKGDLGIGSYFQLNFTSMVSLTYMEVEVLTNGVVIEFILAVKDESGFKVYGITSKQTNFTASGAGMEIFTLWRPIQGNTFRLSILDVTQNDGSVCWNVKTYGCMTSTGPRRNHSKAYIVGAAVGGILVTLLLLSIMVAAIIIFIKKRSALIQPPERVQDSAEHKFDNSIYGHVKIKTKNHSARSKFGSGKTITKTTGFSQATPDRCGSMDRDNADEAYDNPIYA